MAIALFFAWYSLSKPRSIVKQFYLAGVRVQPIKSEKTAEGSNYTYSSPIRNRESIIDVLGRADYHRDQSTVTEPRTEVYVHQGGSFLKSETHRISFKIKNDSLEIISNFPL